MSYFKKIFSLLKKGVVRDVFVYFTSSSLTKLIPFILLPILTRELTVTQFADWSIYQLLLSLMVAVVGMNVQNNITRKFYSVEKKYLQILITQSVELIFLSCMLWTFLSILLFNALKYDSSLHVLWLISIPALAFLTSIIEITLAILRNLQRPFRFASFEVSRGWIDLVFTLTFIYLFSLSLNGKLFALLISLLSISIACIAWLVKSKYLILFKKFSESYYKEILSVCIPLIPHAIAGAVLAIGARLYLELWDTKANVAIYATTYQFAMILSLFGTALNRTWSPWVYRKLSEPEQPIALIEKYALYYWGGIITLVLLVSSVSYFIIPVVLPAEYHLARDFVFYLCLGYGFYCMYNSIFPYYVFFKRTKLISLITILSAVVNFLVSIPLVKNLGLPGAVIGFLGSYIFLFLVSLFVIKRFVIFPKK